MTGPTTFTREQKLACLKRELGLRRSVYPSLVAKGRMKQETADRELFCLRAIIADYEEPDLFAVPV
jgi:hypothetical protein